MDVMIDKKIEVVFIKCEGLSVRFIVYICGFFLEILFIYVNFVELREVFMNIFN